VFARVRICDSQSWTTSAIVLDGESALEPPVLSDFACRRRSARAASSLSAEARNRCKAPLAHVRQPPVFQRSLGELKEFGQLMPCEEGLRDLRRLVHSR
jgi:hypothetical protein